MKKIINISLICFIILSMFSNVFATKLNTKLDIIQKASETKYLENDQGYISKTIVDSNTESGEVTIELKLSNTKKEVEEIQETEIFLVIDNSPSMDFVTQSGKTRKEIVIPAAKKLVEELFNTSSNIKMGVVKFYGGRTVSAASTQMCSLTNNKDTVISTLDKLSLQSTTGGTNILAGLTRANNNFSSKCKNKIIVLLTDGVPNYDLDGNYSGNDTSTEESKIVQDSTKNGLISISNTGTHIISMMTGMSDSDGNTDKEGNVFDDNSVEEDLKAVERIFGTATNPTVGKFYLAQSANIETIVNNDILNDLIQRIQNPINTTKIVDYFPKDITDNFEFSYVGNASIGTTSEKIDEETKTISWDIGTLKGDEVATLKYKLKLKDMQNTELLNKTIATNEKVELTYKDTEKKDYSLTLASSPQIQLSKIIEELTATVSYNPTINTTEGVTAKIKTNKKVNEVDGWILSEDGKTLTKVYSSNATETVHLVDEDNMTKDVEIKISNITIPETETKDEKIEKEEDNTTAIGKLPQTGVSMGINLAIVVVLAGGVFAYFKYNKLRGV